MDKDGKTKRDREIEAQQKRVADQGGEFKAKSGEPAVISQQAARDRNRELAGDEPVAAPGVERNDGRPPVPGVDKFHGGSSAGATNVGQPTHPLPNPNNPSDANNPASTAFRQGGHTGRGDMPPVPAGERTTAETPRDGSSPAQREDEERRKREGGGDKASDRSGQGVG